MARNTTHNLLATTALAVSGYVSICMVAHSLKAQDQALQQRLVSITYNLLEKRLYGEIGIGHVDEQGHFIIEKLGEQYVMDVEAGTMSMEHDVRGFDPTTVEQEKANLKSTLGVLARYMADSIVWWKDGKGVKLTVPEKQARTANTPSTSQGQ